MAELKQGLVYKVLLSKCAYFNKSDEIINMYQLDYDYLEPHGNNNSFTCKFLFDYQVHLFKEDVKNKKYLFVDLINLNYTKFHTSTGYIFYDLIEKKKVVFYHSRYYSGRKSVIDCFQSISK